MTVSGSDRKTLSIHRKPVSLLRRRGHPVKGWEEERVRGGSNP